MSHLLKSLLASALVTACSISPSTGHSAQRIEQMQWTFQSIVCITDCTKDSLRSISPYLGQQLGFGRNRPEFDLLDQCEGDTSIQHQTTKTQELINSIKNSAPPSQRLHIASLNLPGIEVNTGKVLCKDPINNLSSDGDMMFTIILTRPDEMLVWFENQIFLKFTPSSTLHEHATPPDH